MPGWAAGAAPSGPQYLLGRATGSADRAERSAVVYDPRGDAVWGARQVALISDALGTTPASRPAWDDRPSLTEAAPAARQVQYDAAHTYVRTASFDHAGRGTAIVLPADPDYGLLSTPTPAAPVVGGALTYGPRGLPIAASASIGGVAYPVIASIAYTRDGLAERIVYGDGRAGRAATEQTSTYDARRRPTRQRTVRQPDGTGSAPSLGEVSVVFDQALDWDAASNLTATRDLRPASEWPAGHRPRTMRARHDALYRVIGADLDYAGSPSGGDLALDWRAESARGWSAEPMGAVPAPMLPSLPPDRARSLTWSWDWLGNATEWTDDQSSFLERSLGTLGNGLELGARPSALYRASNLPASAPFTGASGGWLEVEYGRGGNVLSLTARAQCTATAGADLCSTTATDPQQAWHELMTCRWSCASEQHYDYRWDELDRLAEARRWDRAGPAASWTLAVRQRQRYDAGNQRVVKQTLDPVTLAERIALYVYPGDFERRGLVRTVSGTYQAADLRSETQYLVAGARLVWQADAPLDPAAWSRNRRLTLPVADLLGSTSATIDLVSGAILETSTYYPNGARETLRLPDTDDRLAAPEVAGFTGKEADEEVGLTYFGERYLISRLGRWATPDPAEIHAVRGGEVLNSYHYVSGNLARGRDLRGLQDSTAAPPPGGAGQPPGGSGQTTIPGADLQDARETAPGSLVFSAMVAGAIVQVRTGVSRVHGVTPDDSVIAIAALNVGNTIRALQFTGIVSAVAWTRSGLIDPWLSDEATKAMISAETVRPDLDGNGQTYMDDKRYWTLDSGRATDGRLRPWYTNAGTWAPGGPVGRLSGQVMYDSPSERRAHGWFTDHPECDRLTTSRAFRTYLMDARRRDIATSPSVGMVSWTHRETYERTPDGSMTWSRVNEFTGFTPGAPLPAAASQMLQRVFPAIQDRTPPLSHALPDRDVDCGVLLRLCPTPGQGVPAAVSGRGRASRLCSPRRAAPCDLL